MRRRTSLLLLAVAGTTLAAFSSLGVANPGTWAESRTGATLAPSGVVEIRDMTLGSSLTECPQAGRIDRDPKPLDRRDVDAVEKKSSERRQPPAQPGLLLLPAGRDVDLDQPGDAEEHPRRGERLPAGHRLVGVLRVDRQRRQLVRRDHPVPVDAATAATSTGTCQRRRSGHGVRPCRNRVLRADRVQPLQRYERGLRSALDERRLHMVARLRRRSTAHHRPTTSRPAAGSAIHASPVTARCRYQPRTPDTLLNGNAPFNDKEWMTDRASAGRRQPDLLRARDAHPEARAIRRPSAVDRVYVTWSKFLTTGGSPIYFSYSDDQGRSWSPEKAISGAASFCVFSAGERVPTSTRPRCRR